MSDQVNRETVLRLWRLFDQGDFGAAGQLLHDDFVCEWPQSRERIRGRDNYIAVNANYPGRWRIAVRRLLVSGDAVATEVDLFNDEDRSQRARAVSFFDLRDGRILRQTDYWPEPSEAPAWRAQWVETMEPAGERWPVDDMQGRE